MTITMDLRAAERLEGEMRERIRSGEQVHFEAEAHRQHWIDRAETHWCPGCRQAYPKARAWGDCPACSATLRGCAGPRCTVQITGTARRRFCSDRCRVSAARVTERGPRKPRSENSQESAR